MCVNHSNIEQNYITNYSIVPMSFIIHNTSTCNCLKKNVSAYNLERYKHI